MNEAKKQWCCFWETTRSNVMAVGINGVFASTFSVGQCIAVYYFAFAFSQTNYFPPPKRPENSPAPLPPPPPPPAPPQLFGAPGKRGSQEQKQQQSMKLVKVALSDEQEDLVRQIKAADWQFEGGGGIASIARNRWMIPPPPPQKVLNPYERGFYTACCLTMIGVNGGLLLVSLAVLFFVNKPKRLVLTIWLIADVIYIMCDVVYHCLLIYTLLNFPRLDMIIWTTWFHAVSATYLMAVFIRVSIQVYAFLFVKDLRSRTGVYSVAKAQKSDLSFSDNEQNGSRTKERQEQQQRRRSSVRMMLAAAAAERNNGNNGDNLPSNSANAGLQAAVARLNRLNIQMNEHQSESAITKAVFFSPPVHDYRAHHQTVVEEEPTAISQKQQLPFIALNNNHVNDMSSMWQSSSTAVVSTGEQGEQSRRRRLLPAVPPQMFPSQQQL